MDTTDMARPSLGKQGWNFARHFLEMCIAMCLGGIVLIVLAFAVVPALIGGPNLRESYPELSLLAIAVMLTLPMVGWMRFRGMAWRPILEMSAVPFGLAIAMIGLVWTGVVPATALQVEFGSFCGITCMGMFIVMLFRLDLYTGRTGHDMGHALPSAQASREGILR
jgi:hypothetical protein